MLGNVQTAVMVGDWELERLSVDEELYGRAGLSVHGYHACARGVPSALLWTSLSYGCVPLLLAEACQDVEALLVSDLDHVLRMNHGGDARKSDCDYEYENDDYSEPVELVRHDSCLRGYSSTRGHRAAVFREVTEPGRRVPACHGHNPHLTRLC